MMCGTTAKDSLRTALSPAVFELPGWAAPHILPACGEVAYLPDYLDAATAGAAFDSLRCAVSWRHERIRLFGRESSVPRLTDWAGDAGVCYRYSGTDHPCVGWPPHLRDLRDRIEAALDWPFNFVLLNRYRDGRDCMGWHADDERSLGPRPVIASLSLGASRRFVLRRRSDCRAIAIDLEPGSLLVMFGSSQHEWRHAVPRTRRPVGERINLTFRRMAGVGR